MRYDFTNSSISSTTYGAKFVVRIHLVLVVGGVLRPLILSHSLGDKNSISRFPTPPVLCSSIGRRECNRHLVEGGNRLLDILTLKICSLFHVLRKRETFLVTRFPLHLLHNLSYLQEEPPSVPPFLY